MIPGPRATSACGFIGRRGPFRFGDRYFHAAAHVIGSLDTHDLIAPQSVGAAALAASVDYRMGAGVRFPAAVEDSFAALEWVHRNAESLGADPDGVGVMRQPGANLAAVPPCSPATQSPEAAAPIAGLPFADYNLVGDSLRKIRPRLRPA